MNTIYGERSSFGDFFRKRVILSAYLQTSLWAEKTKIKVPRNTRRKTLSERNN